MSVGTTPAYPVWNCSRCQKEYVDADEINPGGIKSLPLGAWGVEPREFWLAPTEAICNQCAQELHLTV
jgi:hypothetical protein